MPIFSVIDTSATGDTFYEGMVKDAANWALAETQITNLKAGLTTQVLVGGGSGVTPVWTAASGSGAPVRATSPTLTSATLVTPALGTPASGTLSSCDAATESAKGVAELATTAEAQAGSDTARVVTPAGLNSVVMQNAKTQLINSVYSIITPANMRLFLVFDETGAVSTITDRSTIGGTTAHTTTLRSDPATAINASTCTPGISGLAPYLTLDATHVWSVADAADLSFGDGSNDTAFSAMILFNCTAISTTQHLISKKSSDAAEYILSITGSKLAATFTDKSASNATISRSYDTELTAYQDAFHTYGFTKSTGTTAAAINLLLDGDIVDDTDGGSGSYVAMESLAGTVASAQFAHTTEDFYNYEAVGKISVVFIVAEELDAVQAKRLDAVLRGYAGVTY